MKETDLAKKVVEWLQGYHWDVYQEVQCATYNPIADIVAVQNKLIWIIECKVTLGLTVMMQAYRWKYSAHYVSIAVPFTKRPNKSHWLAEKILRDYGIGLLRVGDNKRYGLRDCEIYEEIAPKLYRNSHLWYNIKKKLCEAQKTFASAGNATGKRWTPFQQTCINLRRLIEKRPGITMTEIMEKIDHHYATPATARSCILKWAKEDIIKGLRLERTGKVYKFYLEKINATK